MNHIEEIEKQLIEAKSQRSEELNQEINEIKSEYSQKLEPLIQERKSIALWLSKQGVKKGRKKKGVEQ